jgi:hypothetical protein
VGVIIAPMQHSEAWTGGYTEVLSLAGNCKKRFGETPNYLVRFRHPNTTLRLSLHRIGRRIAGA